MLSRPGLRAVPGEELRRAGHGAAADAGALRDAHVEAHEDVHVRPGGRPEERGVLGRDAVRERRGAGVGQVDRGVAVGADAVQVAEVHEELVALTGAHREGAGLHRVLEVALVVRDHVEVGVVADERARRRGGLADPAGVEARGVAAGVGAVHDADAVPAGLHGLLGPEHAVHERVVAEVLGHPGRVDERVHAGSDGRLADHAEAGGGRRQRRLAEAVREVDAAVVVEGAVLHGQEEVVLGDAERVARLGHRVEPGVLGAGGQRDVAVADPAGARPGPTRGAPGPSPGRSRPGPRSRCGGSCRWSGHGTRWSPLPGSSGTCRRRRCRADA